MTSATARRRRTHSPSSLGALAALVLITSACTSFVEVAVETPLESKIDVASFRRVMVAGFVTDLEQGEVDVASETARLLQNQLQSSSTMRVLEPDSPPLFEALERILESLGEGDSFTKQEREQYRLEADKLLQDAEFWRKIGEEFQAPLIITGRIDFEAQNRSGFQAEERVVRDPVSRRPRLSRRNQFLERRGFTLDADFHFVDGRTGVVLHKERFTEEVLYAVEQKVSPLSSYFELMDRLLPNFLGVITPQKIRGTRILLR